MTKAILALLAQKFPGVRKDVLNHMAGVLALQVESEDAAKEIVDRMTADKVNAFATSLRSEIDREVAQGIQSNEKKLREQLAAQVKPAEPTQPTAPQAAPNGALTLDQIKALFAETLAPITDRLNAFDRQRVEQTRAEMYQQMLNEAKLPKDMTDMLMQNFGMMSFEDDAKFNQYLADSKPTIAKLAQNAMDAALRADARPNFAARNENGISSAVAAYLDKPAQNELGGKQI